MKISVLNPDTGYTHEYTPSALRRMAKAICGGSGVMIDFDVQFQIGGKAVLRAIHHNDKGMLELVQSVL